MLDLYKDTVHEESSPEGEHMIVTGLGEKCVSVNMEKKPSNCHLGLIPHSACNVTD